MYYRRSLGFTFYHLGVKHLPTVYSQIIHFCLWFFVSPTLKVEIMKTCVPYASRVKWDSVLRHVEIIYKLPCKLTLYYLCSGVGCGFPTSSDSKASACNAGDWVQSLGWEGSPGEGKDYPLHYFGLENSMDTIHGVAKSRTWLSDFHFQGFF